MHTSITAPPRPVQVQIAAAAGVDPVTVRRYFEGVPLRYGTLERIEKALRDRHLPLRPKPSHDGGAPAPAAA